MRNLPEGEDLDELITNLDTELKRIMDTLAPEKEVSLLTRKRQPWYDDQVKAQHKVARNHERVWHKYRLESNWKAYIKNATYAIGFLFLRRGRLYPRK